MSLLIDTLIQEKLLTRDQLNDARQKQVGAQKPLQELLVDMGFVSEEDILMVASRVYKLPIFNLDQEAPDPKALKLVPYHIAKKYGIFPLKFEEQRLLLASSNPQDFQVIEEISEITSFQIKTLLCSKKQISKFIEEFYMLDDGTYDLLKNVTKDPKVEFIHAHKESIINESTKSLIDENSPVVRLLNVILYDAVIQRASDIHIEPYEDIVVVRYRIDGQLKNILRVSKSIQGALAVRIKVLADLNITETRETQDGRSRINIEGRTVDLRLSTIPTFYGERIVLRLLDLKSAQIHIEQLGLLAHEMAQFKEIISRSNGMILVTGATGSGKTSTIYGSLNFIKNENKNIITIEDPVEYLIEGISQIQVNRVKNVTFDNGLRNILRQDPNVIFVGEIRDKETADIAFRSSLTGHLVFSTLHTNSAVATITRLLDLALEPYLIASSLLLIVAQRLVRLNCTHCAKPYQPHELLLKKYAQIIESLGHLNFLKSEGCEHCGFSGFYSRVGIFEFLPFNEEIRHAINQSSGEAEVMRIARKGGLKTLLEAGLIKVSQGLTTLEEVDKVCGGTEMKPDIQGADINPTPLPLPDKPLKSPKILIIDDEDDIRKIVRARLLGAGYEVVEACDGLQGLQAVSQHHPDLIVTDYMMPQMDGIETIKRLRASLETASIPIIMLTAQKDAESEVLGLEMGADDYITKPFDQIKLLTRIKLLLKRKR